jgi:hypothetical protein
MQYPKLTTEPHNDHIDRSKYDTSISNRSDTTKVDWLEKDASIVSMDEQDDVAQTRKMLTSYTIFRTYRYQLSRTSASRA